MRRGTDSRQLLIDEVLIDQACARVLLLDEVLIDQACARAAVRRGTDRSGMCARC